MARSDIPVRRNEVRRWWLHHTQNPMLIRMFAATWSDPKHLERWMDMQARVACAEEGALLASDINWKLIRQQLEYPPLWLAKNWNLTSIKKVSAQFKQRYHILVERNSKLIAIASNTMNNSIAADDERLYEWLGVIGGNKGTLHPAPPATPDS